MANAKINKKYYPIIWIALLIACFARNAYQIYLTVTMSEPAGSLSVFVMIIRYMLSYGVVPMAIVFLCALVVWQIGAARYVRCIPRNDFCYLAMAATAAVKFLVGIIEIFSILEPSIAVISSTVLEFTLLTGAMLALYFFVIAKMYNLNPVEKYNSFKMWSIVYMVALGILVISENAIYISVVDNVLLADYARYGLYDSRWQPAGERKHCRNLYIFRIRYSRYRHCSAVKKKGGAFPQSRNARRVLQAV